MDGPGQIPSEHVSIAVLLMGRRVLIGLRPAGVRLAGYWEFPGGKVEAGEVPAAAVMRELKEELGVDVTIVRPLTPLPPAEAGVRVGLLPFLCRLRDDGDARAIRRTAHAELRWVRIDDLGDYRFPPANAPLLEELRSIGRAGLAQDARRQSGP